MCKWLKVKFSAKLFEICLAWLLLIFCKAVSSLYSLERSPINEGRCVLYANTWQIYLHFLQILHDAANCRDVGVAHLI